MAVEYSVLPYTVRGERERETMGAAGASAARPPLGAVCLRSRAPVRVCGSASVRVAVEYCHIRCGERERETMGAAGAAAARPPLGAVCLRSRAPVRVCASASTSASGGSRRSPYVVLGVDPSADKRAVKAAFRKVALKVHPDVNPSPDAAVRFQEAKDAYELLSDAARRKEYDVRGYRGDFYGGRGAATTGASGRGKAAGAGAAGAAGAREAEEPFYSFGDFWRDVTGDLERMEGKQRKRQGAKDSKAKDEPLSLWEELAALGEEFVEFLEESVPEGKADEDSAGGVAQPKGERRRKTDARGGQPRKPEFDVDAELERMKRDMGLS